ncbi:hypothetical protein MKEN_00399900 [Mycena kentingensis (nom. inval.)]|nr:hypothetical protein MKEN_00399900 [Mycena kentingensis (nom. inval.)]
MVKLGSQSDANDNGLPPWMTSFMGLSSLFAAISMLANVVLGSGANVNLSSSVKQLLIIGPLIELGRRLFQWLSTRLRFQYSITAQFDEGDPAYEWILLFLTQENVWRRSCDFIVTAKNSRRKWDVKTWSDPKVKGNAEYVPTYGEPQLFRWRGSFVEIKRSRESKEARFTSMGTYRQLSSILVTMYTRDISRIADLVEDARARYVEVNMPNVVIHLADSPNYGPGLPWTTVKRKIRRPLNSIILPSGVIDTLVNDAQEFIKEEDWYIEAGIPHRRGYLLYGPPGTGKTSTIYALAGALNLEIYSLSLASSFVDDSFLQRAAGSIPKNSIFLIEDIDCAFPSRNDEDEQAERQAALLSSSAGAGAGMMAAGPTAFAGMAMPMSRSQVTLSGLLNVIDGVGSEEGKLFFATTNYIDRLDPALLRPGRIDHKVQYELATEEQARALFMRFFPVARFPQLAVPADGSEGQEMTEAGTSVKNEEEDRTPGDAPFTQSETTPSAPPATTTPSAATPPPPPAPATILDTLAAAFAAKLPAHEFSTAELQGYLQSHKTNPAAAVAGVQGEEEREERVREKRERLMRGGEKGKEKEDEGKGKSKGVKENDKDKEDAGAASPTRSSDGGFSDVSIPAD